MVSVNPIPNPNPNPAQGFYFFDPSLPGLNAVQPPSNAVTATAGSGCGTMSFQEDQSKKVRKPYTITKSRESWSDQEHDKFLEALQLFDRDWKKIEAFVGSKSVIQIRSHAQKYFLKVQKSGKNEHVPPPRPKRKASHPYPQKAPKNAPVVRQVPCPLQPAPALIEPVSVYRTDSSTMLGNPAPNPSFSSWNYSSVQPVNVPQVTKDDAKLVKPVAQSRGHSTSNESTPKSWTNDGSITQGDHERTAKVMPDFALVYSFIGSIFDPNATGHLEKLKQMDPINRETILLLMTNLSANLTSPEFENLRRLLSSYSIEWGRAKSGISQ